MQSSLVKVIVFVIFASISSTLTAPLEDKQKAGCNTAKGAVRSSVDVGSKDENIHLLADLDALSNGVKRSSIESGCDNAGEKKSKATLLEGSSAISESANKNNIAHVIEETSVINEDEVSKKPIVESGKAAIRSDITANSTASQKSTENATEAKKNENSTSFKVGVGASASKPEAGNADQQGSAAKTFIASKSADVNASKRSGSLSQKVKQLGTKIIKVKKAAKKSIAAKSSEEAPSMQTGALSKETDIQEKAVTKSTSNLLTPLNSAIKSLDSATKLLGMAAASNKHATASHKSTSTSDITSATSKSTESSPDTAKAISEQSAELKPSSASNGTSQDVSSSTRSPGSASTSSKQSSSASTAKAVKAADPYAEIAVGPDSPKMPDLKTGSDKAGLPVMKIDPSGSPPEQVSFGSKGEAVDAPKLPSGGSSSRGGPQDVGGILDQLTDRLNKGGVAPENPLPPTESKAITDQLSDYDHDALDQAKGWEATGLKAIEKLKSAEFTHGNLKTELTKELSDRLAGGYSMEGGIEGAGSDVGNLEAPAQTSYQQPDYSHQHSSQWPEYNSVESLDSEAQREEQPFSQYSEGHGGSYDGGSDPMMSQDQNAYDRQEIPSFLNADMGRDNMDSAAGQEYYKRSLILRPYYSNTVPYAFQYPYDD